jgi:hypothetical protein
MANFAAVRAPPPRLLLAISQPKIKLQNRRSNSTGRQDSTHIAVARRRLSPPFASAQASLLLASVFSIVPSSSRKLMMMVWLHYSTIIHIRVADAGEAGEELEAWGGTLTGRNGRNLTVTADKKIMANLGVTQQPSTALIASRMAAVGQRRKQNQRHDNEGSGGTTIKREAAAAR